MAADTAMEKHEDTVASAERLRAGRSYKPSVDIVELEDEILLLADMPGAKAENIDIDYENGELSIHGRVKTRQDEQTTNYLMREYGVGDFYRTFQVGEGIDASKIEAEVQHGVLKLHLPKADDIRPRRIQVKGT